MSSLVILHSDKDELENINQQLLKDGMRDDLSTEHKLRYVWRLFQRTDTSLQSALDDVAQLRTQQTKDLMEVENYILKIRQTSEQQQVLMSEYEQENFELKQQLLGIQTEIETYVQYSNKISVLLTENNAPEDVLSSGLDTQFQFLIKKKNEMATKYQAAVEKEDTSEKVLNVLNKLSVFETEEAPLVEKLESFVRCHNKLNDNYNNLLEKSVIVEEDKLKVSECCDVLQTEIENIGDLLESQSQVGNGASLKEKVWNLIEVKNQLLIEKQDLEMETSKFYDERIKYEERESVTDKMIAEIENVLVDCTDPISEQMSIEEKVKCVVTRNKELAANLEKQKMEIQTHKEISLKTEEINDELREEIQSVKQEHTKNLEKLRTKFEMKSEDFDNVSKLNAELMKNVEEDSSCIEQLKVEMQNKQSSHERDLADLAKTYEEELNSTIQAYQAEFADIEEERQRYNKLIADLRNLRGKTSHLGKDNKLLKDEIKAYEKEISDLKLELSNGQKDHKENLNRIQNEHSSTLQQLKSQWEMKLSDLLELVEKRNLECEELMTKNKDALQKSRSLKRSASVTSTKLKNIQEKYDQLLKEKSNLDDSILSSRKYGEKKMFENEKLSITNNQLETKISLVNEMLLKQTKELEESKMQLLTIKEELVLKDGLISQIQRDHKEKIKHLQESSEMKSKTVEDLQREIQELKKRKEELLQNSEQTMSIIQKKVEVEEEKSNLVERNVTKMKTQNKELKKELETYQQQRCEEIAELKRGKETLQKQAEEMQKRELGLAEKNTTIMGEVWELREEKASLEKVVIAQEETINNITKNLTDWKEKYSILTATLRESERLNTDISKKLDEYADRKLMHEEQIKSLIDEKTVLNADLESFKDKLEMEQTKFNLLMNKQKNDTDFDIKNLKNENYSLQSQMKTYETEINNLSKKLNKQNQEVERFSDLLKQESDKLRQELISSREQREACRTFELQIEKLECSEKKFEKEVARLSDHLRQEQSLSRELRDACRMSEIQIEKLKCIEKNSDRRQQDIDMSLGQIQEHLMTKSAECAALSISKNTLQNRVNTLEEQNKKLVESNRECKSTCDLLKNEISTMSVDMKNFEEELKEMPSLKGSLQRLSELDNKNKMQIEDLQKQIEHIYVENRQQENVISTLKGSLKSSLEETRLWKRQYTDIQVRFSQLEYEQSDNAIFQLKNHNTDLNNNISCLKGRLNEVKSDLAYQKTQLLSELQISRERTKHDRRSLETITSQLQTSLQLAQCRLDNEMVFERSKVNDYKVLINEKADLAIRIISLEERLNDTERLCKNSENVISFLKNENEELRKVNDRLNLALEGRREIGYLKNINKHTRTVSAPLNNKPLVQTRTYPIGKIIDAESPIIFEGNQNVLVESNYGNRDNRENKKV